jgi:hypothetical protein
MQLGELPIAEAARRQQRHLGVCQTPNGDGLTTARLNRTWLYAHRAIPLARKHFTKR